MKMSPKVTAMTLMAACTMPFIAPQAHGQPRKPRNTQRNATCTFYTHSRLPMADSTRFRSHGLFCASWSLPLHSVIRVTSPRGVSLLLVVRDRGPAYDLPEGTFSRLFGARGVRQGRVRCHVRVVRRGNHGMGGR